jgi:CheY-like chemotaxis protein
MARILIIDQDSTARTTLAGLLRSEGHDVRSTDSNWHAFALCQLSAMDVAVICLFMPGHAGAEATRVLRREFPELGILAFATQTGGEDRSEFALWLGANRILNKPCEPKVFIAAVRDVLSAHEQAKVPMLRG